MTALQYSRGRGIRDNKPAQRQVADFDAFAQAVLSDRAKTKGQTYVCGPFAQGHHSNREKYPDVAPWRQKDLVAPRAFLPFDIDEFATPETFTLVLELLGRYRGFAYTTASHTADKPRCRVVLAQSRPTEREEGIALCRAVQALLERDLGVGRVMFDASVYKAEQPLFTPLHGAETFRFDGQPVDVDAVLVAAPPADAFDACPAPTAAQRVQDAASADTVLQLLDAVGYVKRDMGGGKFAVECPFASEHTGESAETSTVYYLPNFGGVRYGKFHCLHDHCKDRPQEQFIEALGLNPREVWRQQRGDDAEGGSIAIFNSEGKARPQAEVLIDIGYTHTLFHDGGGDGYARLGNGGVYAVVGSEYREILGSAFYKLSGKAANRNALTDAVNTLSAMAKYDGTAEPVYLRVGECEGDIVIDSGEANWGGYRVTAEGWERVEKLPANFRRSGKPKALPTPREPQFSRLWEHVNVKAQDRVLVAAWLLAALRPSGPYPVLLLTGEQGTGKSRAARALKSLVDPSASPLRAPPQDPRDLLVAALSSWVLCLDNMSGADPQLSDALCRLSTGGALSGRTLYTNAEETLIEVQRPVILNGIDDLATRPDLAERCIVLELPRLEQRVTEAALNAGFQDDVGAIFGALLDGLQMALKNVSGQRIDNLPRMADFAMWAAAGLPALGFTTDEFLTAYRGNQASAIEAGLDSSAVGQALRAFMVNRHGWSWSGPASALLSELAGHTESTSQSWPRSPKGLINALRRLAPSLRHVGITWRPVRTGEQNLIELACKDVNDPPQAPLERSNAELVELMEDKGPPCMALGEGSDRHPTRP